MLDDLNRHRTRLRRCPPAQTAGGSAIGGRRGRFPDRGLAIVIIMGVLLSCEPVTMSHAPLPERTIPPDRDDLDPTVEVEGGAVALELTGWVEPIVIEEFVESGLQPLPGYAEVEALDSFGMNTLGGIVPPGGLPLILEHRYIVRIRSLAPDVDPGDH